MLQVASPLRRRRRSDDRLSDPQEESISHSSDFPSHHYTYNTQNGRQRICSLGLLRWSRYVPSNEIAVATSPLYLSGCSPRRTDTSTILAWLIDEGYDVVAFMADVGQEEVR